LVLVALVGLVVVVNIVPSNPGTAEPDHGTVTRDVAIRDVAGLLLEVPSGATLTAKLVTWGEVRKAQTQVLGVASLHDAQRVWAVSVSGGYIPEFARGRRYAWGLLLVDARSGQVVGDLAGNDGTRAPYLDSLADLAPASGARGRSTGNIAGTIREVGGAAPGINRAIPGTVTILDGSGGMRNAHASSAGSFFVKLPTGSYRLSARSPVINSGRTSCLVRTKVVVASDTTTRVDVICDIK
jgi:hypothetical protein